jgi:hypothetical protein
MDGDQPVPSVVFTKEGARLFYVDLLFANLEAQEGMRGAVLRTAFSQKRNGRK